MSRDAIQTIGDILTHELELPNGRIMLTNERYLIPNVNGVYIALSYLSGKPVSVNSYPVPDLPGMSELQQTVMLYQIQIDIMSFDGSARIQKDWIFTALGSIYAQGAMEANNMQVARMASGFIDASSLEESKILNRYTMTIAVTALISRTKTVDYYDEFPTPEVSTNE